QLLHVRAVGVHGVDVEVAVADRREDDLLAIGRDDRFSVVAGLFGELLEIGAVGIRSEDVVAWINAPDVSLGVVGFGRAVGAAEMGGGVENLLAVGKEERTRRAALASRDHVLIAAVDIH